MFCFLYVLCIRLLYPLLKLPFKLILSLYNNSGSDINDTVNCHRQDTHTALTVVVEVQ